MSELMPEARAEQIVASQTGKCLCCDEINSRWNCEKAWVRSITTALREVEAATEQRVWEAAANEALRSYPDDAIAKKISAAIHRRATGGTP